MRKSKKWTKRLAVMTGALALAAQLVMGLGPASAAEGDSPDEFPEDVRGMVVLKLPFGGSSIFSSPRMGFDFQVQNRSEYDRLNHRYDPQTGRRLPDMEADRVRT